MTDFEKRYAEAEAEIERIKASIETSKKLRAQKEEEHEAFVRRVEENMARIHKEFEQMEKEAAEFHREWEAKRADITRTENASYNNTFMNQYLFDENSRLFREEHERFINNCNQNEIINSMILF